MEIILKFKGPTFYESLKVAGSFLRWWKAKLGKDTNNIEYYCNM